MSKYNISFMHLKLVLRSGTRYTAFGQTIVSCFLLISMISTSGNLSAQDFGTNRDNQSWNTIRITTPINNSWSVSLQNEARFTEDMTNLDEYIIKLYAHHKFSEKFGLSFGYKHINRPSDFNETDPWVEAVFPRRYKKWHYGHQVRFETRFSSDLPGILPRLRYMVTYARQLGDTPWYMAGFGAVRFNLDEKGTGPVSGFEQVRANVGLGYHIGGFTRLEVGYLYRFERSREAANLSDNVLHVNLFFTTKRQPKWPLPNAHFQ